MSPTDLDIQQSVDNRCTDEYFIIYNRLAIISRNTKYLYLMHSKNCLYLKLNNQYIVIGMIIEYAFLMSLPLHI